MTSRSVESRKVTGGRETASLPRLGQALILVAAIVAGLAIIADGPISRALNGFGALLWVASAGILVWSLRREPQATQLLPLAAAGAIVLGILVRPSDLAAAIIGFGLAGAVIGLLAVSRALGWALLVPAIYLPVHLVVAIGRSILAGSTSVRTEPPPTAPLVPLAMVLAAGIAGIAVSWVRYRGR